jgi:hypothetical protein
MKPSPIGRPAVGVDAHDCIRPPPPSTVDVQGVGNQVTTLLQIQFDTADGLKHYGLKVDDGMTLINTDLNKYNGLATRPYAQGHPGVPGDRRVGRPHRRDVRSARRRIVGQAGRDSQQGAGATAVASAVVTAR